MPELGPYGSSRGAQGNLRPYRDPRKTGLIGEHCRLSFGTGSTTSAAQRVRQLSWSTTDAALNAVDLPDLTRNGTEA